VRTLKRITVDIVAAGQFVAFGEIQKEAPSGGIEGFRGQERGEEEQKEDYGAFNGYPPLYKVYHKKHPTISPFLVIRPG
jgi:hypothetical protein